MNRVIVFALVLISTLLTVSQPRAQFGACLPGFCGGVTAPTTCTLAGTVAHYDASITSSLHLSGSNLSKWDDISGSGNDADTILFAGTSPTYDATGLNSLPTIVFDASNTQNIAVPTGFTMGNGNTMTAVVVGVLSSTARNGARALAYSQPGAAHDNDNLPSWNLSRDAANAGIKYARNSNTTVVALSGYDVPFRGIVTVNSSGTVTLYVDGASTAGFTSSGNFVTGGVFVLGAGAGTLDNNSYWSTKISEAFVSTLFTNPTDVGVLDTCLKIKWHM